jgi:hypothetical protein
LIIVFAAACANTHLQGILHMELYLQQLVSYFAEVEHQKKGDGIYNHLTSIGQPFVASNLSLVAKGLYELKLSRLIDCSGFFCDAGSADGRIVALAAACLGIPSLGIEYDHRLVGMGRENIAQLEGMGVIRSVPARILEGDFCRDDTYRNIRFQEITTFYCFESNCYCLANKITEESPKEVLFIYYTQNSNAHFEGLQRLRTITLQGEVKESYYMHGFKKL